MVLELTGKNFEEEVKKSAVPVLVDFWASWCGPCRMMGPIVDEIAQEMGNSAKAGKVNVDDENNLAMEYNVMSIPTLIIFKNGKADKTFVGVTSKEELIEALK